MKRKRLALCAVLAAGLLLNACSAGDVSSSLNPTASPQASAAPTAAPESAAQSALPPETAGETLLDLSTGSAQITQSGSYRISGSLGEGSLTVNVDKTVDEGLVHLIFDGVSIASTVTAPVNILGAKDVQITLEAGSSNTLTQGAITTTDTAFPSAALFSKCDLTIDGTGALTVNTAYNDGISSRDDLTINSGTIQVTATADGIVGKDSLTINGGDITLHTGKDGLRATNEVDASKGVLTVSGGTITMDVSAEGLEAMDIAISGGSITVRCGDDGINIKYSTGTLTISGGEIFLSSGGDGLDSNGNILITNGTVTIDTTTIGQIDSPIDCDGSFSQTGGSLVDQNGNQLNVSQMGMGGGMGGGPMSPR